MTADGFLTTEDLAEMFHVSTNTVHYWRSRGLGPRGARVGKRVIYRRSAVEAWIDILIAEDEINLRHDRPA